jgi:hypothetical protein
VFLNGKKGLGKKRGRGDIVTRFWYTLKNLDPIGSPRGNLCWIVLRFGVEWAFCIVKG